MEEWKQVPGFPAYWVSNHGNVESELRGSRRKIRPKWLSSGKRGGVYLAFNARAASKDPPVTIKVHRIVALLFVGPPPEDKPVVMHLDEDKTNNRWDNLEYGTIQENNRRFNEYMARLGFVRQEFNGGWVNTKTGERRV